MRLQTNGTVSAVVLEAVESVSKLLHLVLVPCYVGTYIPLPVLVDDRSSVNAELNTLVGHVAYVHPHGLTTHRGSSRSLQNLVLDVVRVEVELKAQTVVEELVLDTNLKLVLLLRNDVLVAESCRNVNVRIVSVAVH